MFCTQTCKIVNNICHNISKSDCHGQPPDHISNAMRQLVDRVIKTHPSISEITERHTVMLGKENPDVKSVAYQMFEDGVINWGRVITLLAFGELLSHHCERRKILGCVEAISNAIAIFIFDKLALWIIDNGGWEFCLSIHQTYESQSLWNGL